MYHLLSGVPVLFRKVLHILTSLWTDRSFSVMWDCSPLGNIWAVFLWAEPEQDTYECVPPMRFRDMILSQWGIGIPQNICTSEKLLASKRLVFGSTQESCRCAVSMMGTTITITTKWNQEGLAHLSMSLMYIFCVWVNLLRPKYWILKSLLKCPETFQMVQVLNIVTCQGHGWPEISQVSHSPTFQKNQPFKNPVQREFCPVFKVSNVQQN